MESNLHKAVKQFVFNSFKNIKHVEGIASCCMECEKLVKFRLLIDKVYMEKPCIYGRPDVVGEGELIIENYKIKPFFVALEICYKNFPKDLEGIGKNWVRIDIFLDKFEESVSSCPGNIIRVNSSYFFKSLFNNFDDYIAKTIKDRLEVFLWDKCEEEKYLSILHYNFCERMKILNLIYNFYNARKNFAIIDLEKIYCPNCKKKNEAIKNIKIFTFLNNEYYEWHNIISMFSIYCKKFKKIYVLYPRNLKQKIERMNCIFKISTIFNKPIWGGYSSSKRYLNYKIINYCKFCRSKMENIHHNGYELKKIIDFELTEWEENNFYDIITTHGGIIRGGFEKERIKYLV